ncbi:MAG TPA: hypothetical protein PLB84_07380, partial [Rectinema sp.]|nr:hypothetical protein [Rectinema sp.]
SSSSGIYISIGLEFLTGWAGFLFEEKNEGAKNGMERWIWDLALTWFGRLWLRIVFCQPYGAL